MEVCCLRRAALLHAALVLGALQALKQVFVAKTY